MRIADPTQRMQFRGFSLLPPNGSGWMAAPPIPTNPSPVYLVATFGKLQSEPRVDHRVIRSLDQRLTFFEAQLGGLDVEAHL